MGLPFKGGLGESGSCHLVPLAAPSDEVRVLLADESGRSSGKGKNLNPTPAGNTFTMRSDHPTPHSPSTCVHVCNRHVRAYMSVRLWVHV